MKPHKHAELIKAWADGAEIEYRHWGSEWKTAKSPTWDEKWEYRIKQKTVVRWKWAYKADNSWVEMTRFMSESEVPSDCIKLEYTRTEFPE
jgi:hypothetical protein